jgi:hypothetical protein
MCARARVCVCYLLWWISIPLVLEACCVLVVGVSSVKAKLIVFFVSNSTLWQYEFARQYDIVSQHEAVRLFTM